MHKTMLVPLVVLLSFIQLGCLEPLPDTNTEVNGKATLSFMKEMLVLDTGNEGMTPVKTIHGGAWDTTCVEKDAVPLLRLIAESRGAKEFRSISLVGKNVFDRRDPDPLNVQVEFDGYRYYGVCQVDYVKSQDDPLAYDFSTSDCWLNKPGRFDGEDVRVESASFHAKPCVVIGAE